jgi:hypothetical protein
VTEPPAPAAWRSSGRPRPAATKPPFAGFRLRCGDYRVFFDLKDGNTIEIIGVRHGKEAYR